MEKDKTRIKIEDLLKSHNEGLTIQDIMGYINLARHTVLARLHVLIGEGKVSVRKINMAKLHYWNENAPPSESELKAVFKNPNKEKIKLQPLKQEHIKKSPSPKIKTEKPLEINMEQIKREIQQELHGGKIKKETAQIKEQREPIKQIIEQAKEKKKQLNKNFILTGIPGFDELLEEGIPKGDSVLIAGGAGSGKTIFCLQILNYHATKGKKCLYMSLEESEERLIQHMEDFSWQPNELIKKGDLLIKRFNPFDITRSVDAMLLEAKGELLIDIEPIIFPEGFNPDIVVVDSLTAIDSAFTGKEDSYRIYVDQLFRFFEKIKATSFLITETKQIPIIFSTTGVEEFLADGVIVLYNIKRGNIRENAIEILKLRGAKHQKKIVAMQITDNGIVIYPEQEVFGGLVEEG